VRRWSKSLAAARYKTIAGPLVHFEFEKRFTNQQTLNSKQQTVNSQ